MLDKDSSRRLFRLVILCALVIQSSACPKVCKCKWKDGKEWVDCTQANFIDIPRGIDQSSQVLDLKYNNLKILFRDAFIDTGLVNIQKLFLSHCNLIRMEKGSFRSLTNLVELDLSHNRLTQVPNDALQDVPDLREINFCHNNITSLRDTSFSHNRDLVYLDLSHNNIQHIEYTTFKPLIKLKLLRLAYNQLSTLRKNMVRHLAQLHEITLNKNMWSCDCHLGPLVSWLDERKLLIDAVPVCSKPTELSGRLWTKVPSAEFICVPEVSVLASRILAISGENVTLSCNVKTEVMAKVMWLIGNKLLSDNSDEEDGRYIIEEIIEPEQGSLTIMSNLTLENAEIRDQDIYRCVVQSKAGSVESNVTLQVSEAIKEDPLIARDNPFVAGIIAGGIACFLTLASVVCIIVHKKACNRHRSLAKMSKEASEMTNINLSDCPAPSTVDAYSLFTAINTGPNTGSSDFSSTYAPAPQNIPFCKNLPYGSVTQKDLVIPETERTSNLMSPQQKLKILSNSDVINIAVGGGTSQFCTLPRSSYI